MIPGLVRGCPGQWHNQASPVQVEPEPARPASAQRPPYRPAGSLCPVSRRRSSQKGGRVSKPGETSRQQEP